jgi:osmotically-inducible protein OsmY
MLACGGGAIGTAIAADTGKTVDQTLSDSNKEGRIWASFALNSHLNPFEFDIDVKGDTATLSGTVDESIDKELAEQVALGVSGVKHVVNNVTVDPNWTPKKRAADAERSVGQFAQDATLTATVKSKLLWSENTDGLDINVDTMNNVVTLRGVVPTAEAKDLAGRYAANTSGVRGVRNELTVGKEAKVATRSDQPVSDAWITAKVKSSLTFSRSLMDDDIDVSTKDGVVTLSGAVESPSEKKLAIELADGVRGAKSVHADGLKTRR